MLILFHKRGEGEMFLPGFNWCASAHNLVFYAGIFAIQLRMGMPPVIKFWRSCAPKYMGIEFDVPTNSIRVNGVRISMEALDRLTAHSRRVVTIERHDDLVWITEHHDSER